MTVVRLADSNEYDKRVGTKEESQRTINAYVFMEEKLNQLQMTYNFRTYLIIKKRWVPARFWNGNEMRAYGGREDKGLTLPTVLYYYISDKPDKLITLAVYVIQEDKFYSISAGDLQEWATKKNCNFIDIFGGDVIGIPKDKFTEVVYEKAG